MTILLSQYQEILAYVEGGINSPIRDLLKKHRGLNQKHMMRLVEWYLFKRAGLSTNDINIDRFIDKASKKPPQNEK